MRKKSSVGKYKIAIYIRVSTEEQAVNPEGSIKNQEQRLREYVKQKSSNGSFGEIAAIYCDPGISAKDMNRPGLQKMLSSIRRGEINLVLVTEVSRLTRSMKDFANLWDFLKEHDCQFQSLRDNFDTTTPAGEMILFTLANFAQFERKQLGERISNAFQARARRGLWNGGVLPLGYELDAERPGHLKVVESEAEIVRSVFATFFREETLAQTGKSLNAQGIKLPRKPRNGGSYRHSHFAIESTYRILTNRAYIAKRSTKTHEGQKEVDAVWPKLIDEAQFNRAQKMLSANNARKKPASPARYPYMLSGLVLCKACGDRLAGKSAHGNGGKIAYYEHAWSTKNQSCLSKKVFACEPKRVLAKKIEPVVWEDVRRLLRNKEYGETLFAEAKARTQNLKQGHDAKTLEAKISSLESQIEATTERVTELPKGINAQSFYDQILRLQKAKEECETKILAMKAQNLNQDSVLRISDFTKFTEDLRKLSEKTTDPNVKAAICRKLIEKVEVSTSGITIHYHVGDHHYEKEFGRLSSRVHLGESRSEDQSQSWGLVEKSARPLFISRPLAKYRTSNEDLNTTNREAVRGSNSLTSGRG